MTNRDPRQFFSRTCFTDALTEPAAALRPALGQPGGVRPA